MDLSCHKTGTACTVFPQMSELNLSVCLPNSASIHWNIVGVYDTVKCNWKCKTSSLADLIKKKMQSRHYLCSDARHVHMTGFNKHCEILSLMKQGFLGLHETFTLSHPSLPHTHSHKHKHFLCLGESLIAGVKTGALKPEQSFTSCNHFSNQASIMFSAMFLLERGPFSWTRAQLQH